MASATLPFVVIPPLLSRRSSRPFVAPEVSPMLGTLLTQWTIRLALICFVAYLAGALLVRGPSWRAVVRWIWTVGCGLFLLHVVCAFHFYHHWSHAIAWEETARQTRDLIGVAFGDGIYFSYAFSILWVADVAGLWWRPSRRKQSSTPAAPQPLDRDGNDRPETHGVWRPAAILRGGVVAFLIFIAFNGAIVFEAGPTRRWGIGASLVLVALALGRGLVWLSQERRNTAPIEPDLQGSGLSVQE